MALFHPVGRAALARRHGRELEPDDVRAEGTSRVTYEIDEFAPGQCSLVVTHDELREGANEQLYGGWPMILSGLKTWLETGEELVTPGSLLYGALTGPVSP